MIAVVGIGLFTFPNFSRNTTCCHGVSKLTGNLISSSKTYLGYHQRKYQGIVLLAPLEGNMVKAVFKVVYII